MTLTQKEKDLVEKYRNGYRGIFWGIADFEAKAKEKEECDGNIKYDRDLFETALDKMIDSHDAEQGITWDTISYYLDTYCAILPKNQNT